MNSSSLKSQLSSGDELLSDGPNEQRTVRGWTSMGWTMEGESAIDSLPNDVLLVIFHLLSTDQLLIAEQVCLRWKSVVSTCFATTRYLKLCGQVNALMRMKRYGPSLKSLELDSCIYDNVDWMREIGDCFPNLSSLIIDEMQIKSKSLSVLAVKCCQLTRLSFMYCHLTNEHLRIIFRGLPRLKYLKLVGDFEDDYENILGECFREIGTNIEHLSIRMVMLTESGTSHILSRATNLQTLRIDLDFECDAHNFSKFCEKSPLRELKMYKSELPREVFLPISSLCLLEKLKLIRCPKVDSDVIVGIGHGCPNLKFVNLDGLPLVCDRGVKALANCRRLICLQLFKLHDVTDESLFELAKAGTLHSLTCMSRSVSDRGVSAILAQCPHLVFLDVNRCGVGDSTVDAAIRAVESRRRCLNPTLGQSPRGPSTAIVPRFKSRNRNHLLSLRISRNGLNRYKNRLSHPLLHLKLC